MAYVSKKMRLQRDLDQRRIKWYLQHIIELKRSKLEFQRRKVVKLRRAFQSYVGRCEQRKNELYSQS